MGHIYKYNEYKCRKDFIKETPSLEIGKPVLFHPFDVTEAKCSDKIIYGEHTYKYAIIVLGVSTTGEKMEVIIDNIPIYFDVRLGSDDKIVYELNTIIKEFFLSTEVVYKFPGINFHEEKQRYLRIYFPNVFNRDRALDRVIQAKLETATDFKKSQWLNHVMVENELTVSDWVLVTPIKYEKVEDDYLGNKHVIFTRLSGYVPVNKPLSTEKNIPDSIDIPTNVIYFKLAWDIEVYSSTGEFPTPENINDDVFMIGGAIYLSTQEEPILPFCICHKPMTYVDGDPKNAWDLIQCKSEKEVLEAFMDILRKFQPEFRMAFNNYGFDNPFVFKRANQSHINILKKYIDDISPLPLDYYRTSKKTSDFSTIVAMEKIKMEGAFDSNAEKFVIKIPGTIDLDMMIYLKRTTYKKEDTLGGHALRAYLDKYGLPNKLDISFADMQEAYRVNNTDVMREVAEYCVVDALSCERLQNKTGSIMGLMSLAHLSMTPIYNCMVRAGGSRIQNALYCQGYRNDVIYTDHPQNKPTYDGKYPGAIVFNPLKGRYLDSPIMALDYQSLYPSIMRALWMSSETFTDEETAISLRERGFDVFEFTYPLTFGTEERNVTVYFVREDPLGNKVRGVFPQCLELLMDLRVHYKNMMKKSKDPVTKKLCDEKQKATKILMNTAYGKIGSPLFALYNVFISSAITMYGRKVLTLAKEIGERMGYELIYGDSITEDTPVSIKYGDSGIIRNTKVKHVIDDYQWIARSDGKQYYTPPQRSPLYIKECDGKYVQILNMIRHKTCKRIYRIRDSNGFVDVTEDHSLVLDNKFKTKITPDQFIEIRRQGMYVALLGATSPVSVYLLHETYSNYVYDFSTESELYHAGTSTVILHNTDSIFIRAPDLIYKNFDTPAERVAHAQQLAKPVATEINKQNRLLLGDKDNFDTITMNLDKFLHPATFCAKKKYLGRDWDIVDLSDPKHPEEGELYISGLEVTKRGKTELLKDTSYKVIEKLNDFEYRGGIVEVVEKILQDAVDDISRKPRDYFFKKQKFTDGKTGSMGQFIERMKQKQKENPTLYNIPNSGEYVEVAIVKSIDHLKANGCLRPAKISDRMEFRNIIEHFDLQIDIKYYLEDILGTLARFINSDPRFEPTDALTLAPDEIDKKSQANAEKYLKQKLEEYTGGTGYIELTQVKKNRKALHTKYAKYGGFVQTMMDAYDANICDNIISYILAEAKVCGQEEVKTSLTPDEIKENIFCLESYILSKADRAQSLYKKYREDIKAVSKGLDVTPPDDIDPAKIIKLQNKINSLRKYYGMRSMENIDKIEMALDVVFR